jgi:Tol biopolymer transport system component
VTPGLRHAVMAAALCASACSEPARTEAPSPASAPKSSGPTLVYERHTNGIPDIVLMPAGGVERRLTQHPKSDSLPRFTPDGRRVLFTSDRTGEWQIYEVGLEGGEPVRVRSTGHTEWQVDLSPDGRTLAFLSKEGGPESLWLMDWTTRAARMLVRHGNSSVLGNPDWSPDGRRIVFSSNWRIGHQIYVADVATGEAERLSPLRKGGCEPRFSPDGRKVAYTSRGHLSAHSRIVAHDVETHEETVLVDWPALNYDVAWSPRGDEIAFASNITGDYQVYRLRLADGKSWRVSFGAGEARYPDYQP